MVFIILHTRASKENYTRTHMCLYVGRQIEYEIKDTIRIISVQDSSLLIDALRLHHKAKIIYQW